MAAEAIDDDCVITGQAHMRTHRTTRSDTHVPEDKRTCGALIGFREVVAIDILFLSAGGVSFPPGTFALPNPVEISESEWMIPFNLQTDVPKIHLRAGFNKSGL